MDAKPTNREVRIANRKRVINTLLRQGPMTIQALTVQTSLSHGTVTSIVKELSGQGLVARGDTLASSGGRPPSHVTLVFDARCAIGISVSTNHVRILQVNMEPRIVNCEKLALPMGNTPEYWAHISRLLEDFIQRHGIDEASLLGVGLSIQAPVEKGRGVAHAPSITAFSSQLNQDAVLQTFQRPVSINNDAKAACYAQVWGKNYNEDLVFLFLGSGVGGAIIIDQRIWDCGGKNAEFGHVVLNEDGPLCSCGRHGCLGSYCASRALRQAAGAELDEFFSGLTARDAKYKAIWEEYFHYLALGISNIHTIFDTDIIIGGEMSQYLKPYAPELEQRLDALDPFGEPSGYLRVGDYGEYDSAMGAALLHLDAFLNQ